MTPEIPSLAELGVRDFSLDVWAALVGPATLSRAAQERLNVEVQKAMRTDEVRQRLFNQGWQTIATSPEGLRTRVKSEAAEMSRLIAQHGIKVE